MPRPRQGEIQIAEEGPRAYGNHMTKITELTVTRVGNSRGVRLPAEVLRRYRVGDALIMEQRPDEIWYASETHPPTKAQLGRDLPADGPSR